MAIENTDLERRVLAHERILQALIQHMAEEEPDIVVRLKRSFGRGQSLGQDEQDHVSTKQYGEQFVEAIEQALGSRRTPS